MCECVVRVCWQYIHWFLSAVEMANTNHAGSNKSGDRLQLSKPFLCQTINHGPDYDATALFVQ